MKELNLLHLSWSPYEDLNPNRLTPNQERYQITLYGVYLSIHQLQALPLLRIKNGESFRDDLDTTV